MKNYPMQYADREISVEDALEVLDEGEFITMATVDDDGMPYCVPLSYVVERGWGSVEVAGEGEEPVCRIYIHTTKNDGHKMADWRRDARVWGSVACEVEPCYEETFFERDGCGSHSSRRELACGAQDARSVVHEIHAFRKARDWWRD